jgi:hypothetical protein
MQVDHVMSNSFGLGIRLRVLGRERLNSRAPTVANGPDVAFARGKAAPPPRALTCAPRLVAAAGFAGSRPANSPSRSRIKERAAGAKALEEQTAALRQPRSVKDRAETSRWKENSRRCRTRNQSILPPQRKRAQERRVLRHGPRDRAFQQEISGPEDQELDLMEQADQLRAQIAAEEKETRHETINRQTNDESG